MKLYLGLLESSLPGQTRIFGDVDGKLVDLNFTCAACLIQLDNNRSNAYELAAYHFPETIAEFLDRGEQSLKILDQVVAFAHKNGAHNLRGPAGEKVVYDPAECLSRNRRW